MHKRCSCDSVSCYRTQLSMLAASTTAGIGNAPESKMAFWRKRYPRSIYGPVSATGTIDCATAARSPPAAILFDNPRCRRRCRCRWPGAGSGENGPERAHVADAEACTAGKARRHVRSCGLNVDAVISPG